MKCKMTRIGAYLCVLAFMAGSFSIPGLAAGPRNPGPDPYVTPVDIVFKVGGSQTGSAVQATFVTVNVTVHNAGDSAATSVNVSWYDGAIFIASGQVGGSIAPAGTGFCETVWNTTASNVGNHTIRVDVLDFIADDNSNNNTAYANFTILPIPRSHVYVSDIAMPSDALVGDTVKVTATLKNDGTRDQTDPDTAKFHVGTTPLPNGLLPYPVPLPADNVSSTSVDFIWDTTNMQEGPYFIMVEVGSSRVKKDSPHIINLTFPRPNAYISLITVDKDSILQGESVHFTVKVKNNGTKNATDEEIWFLVDNSSSPTTNHTKTGVIPKTNTEVSFSFEWNSTDAAPGNHTFKARVPGSTDQNATRQSPPVNVQARVPNVALTSFNANPPTVKSGDTVTLTAVLENTGTADAYNQEVKFFLNSTDTFPVATKKMNVRSGASVTVNTTYIAETGETDITLNFWALFADKKINDSVIVKSTVPLRPDLAVQSVEAQRDMIINREYLITATLVNRGRASAYNFSVKFNLGTELPYVIKNVDLTTGETTVVNWTFKPTIAGSGLKLKVEADALGIVQESDEFNNINESIRDIAVKAEARPAIELSSAAPNKKSFDVIKGEKATAKITVILQNTGGKDGTVFLKIREGLVEFVGENVTVPANQTVTMTYKWNITGAKTHTAKVLIEGADAGLVTSRILSVDLSEKTPGFETVIMVAAIAVVAILVRRRK